MADLITHFSNITEKRKPNGIRHNLLSIIVIAICGVICGADDWVMIEYFGNAKREWFETFLELPHGIPSHDTFGNVFARYPSINGKWSIFLVRRQPLRTLLENIN